MVAGIIHNSFPASFVLGVLRRRTCSLLPTTSPHSLTPSLPHSVNPLTPPLAPSPPPQGGPLEAKAKDRRIRRTLELLGPPDPDTGVPAVVGRRELLYRDRMEMQTVNRWGGEWWQFM